MIAQARKLDRAGLTIIELVVVIGVLMILASLLLPAVQSAREAARRIQCGNNLRQLAIGLAAYQETYGSLPARTLIRHDALTPSIQMHQIYYSVFVRTLPFLDQGPLFNSVNFSVSTFPLQTFGWGRLSDEEQRLNQINQTAYATSLSGFLCPSDFVTSSTPLINYRGNTGVGHAYKTKAEHPDSGNGVFPESTVVRPAMITDGLSNTAMLSERLVSGPNAGTLAPERNFYALPVMVSTADDLLLACNLGARADAMQYASAGHGWFWSGRERTLYNHAQVPNGIIPDCLQMSHRTAYGMASARSWHKGGVNVAMADGSVRFIGDSVSQPLWRAIGTRNGGEVIDLP